MRRTSGYWTDAEVETLRSAWKHGRETAAIAAIPYRSRVSVKQAIRRYCFVTPIEGAATLLDRDTIRKRLHALPAEQLIEGVRALLVRRADFIPDMTNSPQGAHAC